MYKTRIHQWGLDKKLKDHEARAIIHMHARRRGKATRMRLRDLPVDIEKVYSHFQRKGTTIDSVLASDAASLPDLVCETPAASPAPMSQDLVSMIPADSIIPELQSLMTMAGPQDLGSPRAFRVGEMLFVNAREYLLGTIPFRYDCSVVRNDPRGLRARKKLYNTIGKALRLFDRHQELQAHVLVARKYSNAESIAIYMSSYAVLELITLIAVLLGKQQKHKSAASMLCKQLYTAAINFNSGKDPIISVFGRFLLNLGLLLHTDDAADYLLATVHVFIDSLKTILGPNHSRTVFAAVVLSRVTRVLYGPKGLLKPLETLRSSLEEQHGWGGIDSAMIKAETIQLNMECGHYQTARDLVGELEKFVILHKLQGVFFEGLARWDGVIFEG